MCWPRERRPCWRHALHHLSTKKLCDKRCSESRDPGTWLGRRMRSHKVNKYGCWHCCAHTTTLSFLPLCSPKTLLDPPPPPPPPPPPFFFSFLFLFSHGCDHILCGIRAVSKERVPKVQQGDPQQVVAVWTYGATV